MAQERQIEIALSNSFGFGGTNASIIFRAPPDDRGAGSRVLAVACAASLALLVASCVARRGVSPVAGSCAARLDRARARSPARRARWWCRAAATEQVAGALLHAGVIARCLRASRAAAWRPAGEGRCAPPSSPSPPAPACAQVLAVLRTAQAGAAPADHPRRADRAADHRRCCEPRRRLTGESPVPEEGSVLPRDLCLRVGRRPAPRCSTAPRAAMDGRSTGLGQPRARTCRWPRPREALILASIVERETAQARGAAARRRRLPEPAAARHAAAIRPDRRLCA